MKTIQLTTLALFCTAGLLARAIAQDTPATGNTAPAQAAAAEPSSADLLKLLKAQQEQIQTLNDTLTKLLEQRDRPNPDQIISPTRDTTVRAQRDQARGGRGRSPRGGESSDILQTAPDLLATPNSLDDTNANIVLNFRGAALEQVLTYLSEAAGFVIVLDQRPSGTVDLFSEHPVTKKDAIEALNQAVWKSGYVIGVNGNLLTLRSSGFKQDWSTPIVHLDATNFVPPSAQQVTAIIPVRYVTASEVMQNIYQLNMLPSSAMMTANNNGNSLLLVDSMYTVHRVANLARALDNPVASGTKTKIVFLNYADSQELASIIQTLYSGQGRGGGGGNNPFQGLFGRGGGGGGGFNPFGGGGFNPFGGGGGGGRGGGGGGRGR